MSIIQRVVFLIALFFFGSPVGAAIVASSDFDFDTDGWYWDTVQNPAFSWQPAGGNPLGYIRYDDNQDQGGTSWIYAPDKFLGNWSDLDVTHIAYQQNVFNTGSIWRVGAYTVSISGPGGEANWTGPLADSATPWKSLNVPLREEGGTLDGWTIDVGSWSDILENVTELKISNELYGNYTPFDITGIDNIELHATPIPSTFPLLVSAIALTGFVRRSKKNTKAKI